MAAENDVTYFARTNFRNRERLFGIHQIDRRQHMYVIGQTGTGKSTFLKNMALQDIQSGAGVCIVDPHGEFVEDMLTMIPPSREEDIIYFNPADSEYPLGFNVLEIPDMTNPQYKPLAASSLMGIFTKIWANVWSARMEYILNNAVLALLDTPGTTLLGIQRILVDKEYRARILSNVRDPVVRAFWLQEYEQYDPRFRNEAIAPIQNKVGQFLSSSMVRNIVGQEKSTFNLYDAMNAKKVILVNVSKGRIGEDNAQLLGAMIITKLQLAAMERVRIPEDRREDFYLYVDEFQNFATDSFASILSEARKYRLNLIIAHQYIGQLVTDTSTRVRDAVFGNVGTMVVFRVGATDAEFLEKEFAPELTIEDLVGLPNHHVFLKLMINQIRSRPFSANTLPPLVPEIAAVPTEEIVNGSRKKYARPRVVVEDEIMQSSEFEIAPPKQRPPKQFLRRTIEQHPQQEPMRSAPVRDVAEPEPAATPAHQLPPMQQGNLVVRPAPPNHTISLSQLERNASAAPARGTVQQHAQPPVRSVQHRPNNRTGLRKALADALQKKDAPVSASSPQFQSRAHGIPQEHHGQVLAPGQSIKL